VRHVLASRATNTSRRLASEIEQWATRVENATRVKQQLEDQLASAKKELSHSQSASQALLQDNSARLELQQKYEQLGREYSRALDKIETLEDQVSRKYSIDTLTRVTLADVAQC
jgi:chromosome segregation ATPase